MTAEQIMKKALDGWFYTHDTEAQKIRRRRVPLDYKPGQVFCEPPPPPKPHPHLKIWTRAEDDQLLAMFDEGHSFQRMADALKISQTLAHNRFVALCKMRGITPPRRRTNQIFPPEIEAQVVYMHLEKKMTLREIGEALHMSKNQAHGLWSRWRDRQEIEQAA